jgi:hypothetical protein
MLKHGWAFCGMYSGSCAKKKRPPTDADPSEFFLNTKSFTLKIKCLIGSSARA